jgi:hypothetical protein
MLDLSEPRKPLLRQITAEVSDYFCRYDGKGEWARFRTSCAESAARQFRRSARAYGKERKIDVIGPGGENYYYTLRDLGRDRYLRPQKAGLDSR